MGNPWVAVGQKGAHHKGLAAMREDNDDDGSDRRLSAVKV
jgi:hypothetical protein